MNPDGNATTVSDRGMAPRRATAGLKILVVDDESLIRWSLGETLRAAGHHVIEAADAAGAIIALSQPIAPDVIFLDYRLPDSRDLKLLSTIQTLSPRAIVIMMTAFGTSEMIDHALRLGAFGVLSKPFDVGDLPSLIARASQTHLRFN
jgi:two-component system nitrogen regulation response regulator GlnG